MIATRTLPAPEDQYMRLSDVPWNAYVALCDGLPERHIRITYDRGEMEVMAVSFKHENRKKRLEHSQEESVQLFLRGKGK